MASPYCRSELLKPACGESQQQAALSHPAVTHKEDLHIVTAND